MEQWILFVSCAFLCNVNDLCNEGLTPALISICDGGNIYIQLFDRCEQVQS